MKMHDASRGSVRAKRGRVGVSARERESESEREREKEGEREKEREKAPSAGGADGAVATIARRVQLSSVKMFNDVW